MHPFGRQRNLARAAFLLVSPGLAPRRPEIAGRGMEPPVIANLVEEARKIGGYVLECCVLPEIHCLGLHCLREAFRLGVIARVAAAAHGANEAISGAQLLVIGRRNCESRDRIRGSAA